jgi:hypothetical protein
MRKTLQPDKDGVKKRRMKYGARLPCVHYRYDARREAALRQEVKGAGEQGDSQRRVWKLHEERAEALGVSKRGMEEKVAKYRNLMLLDIGSIKLLNIGPPHVLDLATCRYRQRHVATNGNHASRIS